MDAYSDFTRSAMEILNNAQTTGDQKEASMNALREGLAATLNLLGGLSGVDMSQYLPPGYDGSSGGGGSNGSDNPDIITYTDPFGRSQEFDVTDKDSKPPMGESWFWSVVQERWIKGEG